MKKNASLSLSVNAIVVLIMAITMLGLGLGFITGMFGKMSTKMEQQISREPEPIVPSAFKPITLSREMIITHANEDEIIKVGIFNPTETPWSSVKPDISCTELTTIKSQVNEKNIEHGKSEIFNVLLTIPVVPQSTYLCQIEMMDTYKTDFAIKIIQ